ncbi:MAG: universal stress protein [bacterium]|nr:universal stress protein [bacterium]
MKLLVAYDGSACSEAALDDLVLAGLPESSEAYVISIAEVWLPIASSETAATARADVAGASRNTSLNKPVEVGNKVIAEAEVLANHAKRRIQRMFPSWSPTSEATHGSPARAILERAAERDTDLIVVGSHGRSAISRLFLGSISQKVLTEAKCCVRVARGRIEIDPTPTRLIIGFDGSKGAQAAVSAVARRSWRQGTEIRVIVATSEVSPPTITRFVPPAACKAPEISSLERDSIEKLAVWSLDALHAKNVSATLHLYSGNPKEIIVEEAKNWNADCIFLGANSFGSEGDSFALGSTAAAVAARATCSVEVVR